MSLIKLLRKKTTNALFTTPSHGGKIFIYHKFRQFYKSDISETDTHNPTAALFKAEEAASKIYGTNYTYFLTNGSSSGIIASVLACVKSGDKVLLHEDAHLSHLNAVKLAGALPVFYKLPLNSDWGVYDKNSVENLEPYLKNNEIKAVIITSPTYEGFVSDIKSIKELCEKYGAYLITDEAHGALYPFSERLPQSAVKISDFTIQSLHKTAGGLNPTALLHSNCDINPSEALKMINTTSPSYPLLTTIEANINFLNSQKGKRKIEELIDNILALRNSCSNIVFGGDDLTKILIKSGSLDGNELSERLFEFGIEDERSNESSVLLLTGIGTDLKKIERLKKVLKKCNKL